MIRNEKPGQPVGAGAGLTKQNNLSANYSWTLPLWPDVEIELHTRLFMNGDYDQVALVSADCADFLSDKRSNANLLLTIFPTDISFEHYSWPVFNKPVDLYLGEETWVMSRRWLDTLFSYQPKSVETHLHTYGYWQESKLYAPERLGMAA